MQDFRKYVTMHAKNHERTINCTWPNFIKLFTASSNFIKLACKSKELCKVVGEFYELCEVVEKF